MSFNVEKNVNEVVEWIQNYHTKSNTKGFVLGISGGKDSATVASLLVKAVGKEKVFGVLMPNGEQSDINDSINVCETLGINYSTVNINNSYNAVLDMIPSSENKETKINILPRLRMITLYSIASEKGYLVAGTGNLSERYVGYFTKWGDGACDINPIGEFTTKQVVEIGEYLGAYEGAIHKKPSDGISGSTDEEKLGFLYSEVNEFIENGSISNKETQEKIIARNIANKHKLELPPIFQKEN